MNKINGSLISSILFLGIVGCGKTPSVENFSESSPVNPSLVSDSTAISLVDSVSFLPLGEINGKTLKAAGKVRFSGGLVYVGDHFMNTDKIFVYDATSGKPKFLLDSRGQGPEEYLEIRNFSADPEGLYVIDNYAGKLKVYDPVDGKYLKEMSLPIVASDIEPLPSGSFVLAATLNMPNMGELSIPQDNHRLFITDDNLNITGKLIPVKRGEEGVMSTPRIFTKNGNHIYFYSTMHECIHDLTGLDDKKLRKIPLVLENGLEGHSDVSVEEIGNYDYMFDSPIVTDKHIYLEGKGGYGIWDRRNGKFYKDANGTDGTLMMGRMIAADGDAFISYTDGPEMYGQLKERFSLTPDPGLEQMLSNGEGALVFYHMK